jgi:hypothetical protein
MVRELAGEIIPNIIKDFPIEAFKIKSDVVEELCAVLNS